LSASVTVKNAVPTVFDTTIIQTPVYDFSEVLESWNTYMG
jgi:hypothetical protein